MSDREKNKEFAILTPIDVDESKLCKGSHSWIESLSVNDAGEYSPLSICDKCGFIPSKNLMASEEALKRVINNNRIRQLEETIQKDFLDKESADIKKLLEDEEPKNTLTDTKIGRIYNAGQTWNKRYIIYKIARTEELMREPKEDA